MTDFHFGAKLKGSELASFTFWAPDCNDVEVLIEASSYSMARGEDGVFRCEVACKPGTRYRYKVDNRLIVPDPASHLQSSDVHDDSVVVDHNYFWKHLNWVGRPWTESIIYELHPGSFGGFTGIKNQISRLANLGITAIELMPIADFPGQRNWGYDGVLPYAPDTAYGTPDELKDLIDSAHGTGLQVFLDVVYNHFGPEGNFLGSYASSFFRDDIKTPWGQAIDFRQSHVRRFFIENALFWLCEYRFDGLRFDAVHAIQDKNFLAEMANEIRDRTTGRHIHLILENEKNDSDLLRINSDDDKFDAQWNDDWHHCLHVLLTGESESYYGDFQKPADQLARCLNEGFAYQGEASLHAAGTPRGTVSAHLPSTAFVNCLQNHDQVGNRSFGERLTTLANPDALRAAITLLILSPNIPMLFMGEEWGETMPFLFFTDYHDELASAVRDGRREEFSKFEAFTDPARRGKIPDPNALATFLLSAPKFPECPDVSQARILEFYQTLIGLRATHIVPHLVGTTSLNAVALAGRGVRAEWRLGNYAQLTIGCNFGDEDLSCAHGRGQILFQSKEIVISSNILPPCSTIVWLTEK